MRILYLTLSFIFAVLMVVPETAAQQASGDPDIKRNEFGGGLRSSETDRRGISIGYKYQHISNGYTSSINPGVDVQMVHVGYFNRR